MHIYHLKKYLSILCPIVFIKRFLNWSELLYRLKKEMYVKVELALLCISDLRNMFITYDWVRANISQEQTRGCRYNTVPYNMAYSTATND